MASGLHLRRASMEDLERLGAVVARANATYREWAGESWQPPGAELEAGRWRESLEDPAAWTAVAVREDEVVGGVSFTDARTRGGDGEVRPGVAHLSRLFVCPESWGGGSGGELLACAVEEMARRGYRSAQLYTGEGNARSRCFYEERGWRLSDGTRRWRGLNLVRYTLKLRR